MGEVIGPVLDTRALMRPLDTLLLECLKELQGEDWQRTTTATNWTVKDVAAHLLDSKLRRIALIRDGYSGTLAPGADFIAFFNELNTTWVRAFDRISPELLMDLHSAVHDTHVATYETADLHTPAPYGVSWAGQEASPNWFHLAREYTEQWHHQQQVRYAVGDDTLLAPDWYTPYLDTSFRALPHWLSSIKAPTGTRIDVCVRGIESRWAVERAETAWVWAADSLPAPNALTFSSEHAWQVLSHAHEKEDYPADAFQWVGETAFLPPLLAAKAVVR